MVVLHIYSTSIEVFLHRGMGARYLGLQAVFVLFLVPLHTGFMRTKDPSLTGLFLLAYLGACLGQRVFILARHRTGQVVHSRYNGYSWLLGAKSRFDELNWKGRAEPLLVLAGGLLFAVLDEGFGSYIMTAGGAMFFKNLLHQQHRSQELMDMQDSLVEQQQRAAQFRQMNDGYRKSRFSGRLGGDISQAHRDGVVLRPDLTGNRWEVITRGRVRSASDEAELREYAVPSRSLGLRER